MKIFDTAVVGGGPGGYTAAAHLARLGKSVVLFEKKRLGGCCLHVGCIPTKLLQSAAVRYHLLSKEGKAWGIAADNVRLDFPTLVDRTARTVSVLERGIESMLKASGQVSVVQGEAEVKGPDLVSCGGEEYKTSLLVLAQGSRPKTLPSLPVGRSIVTSDELLTTMRLPKSLLVVGAGVIGMEFACLYAQLGVKVRLGDVAPSILPALDPEAAQILLNAVRRLGVEVELGVKTVAPKDEELTLVAVGRTPNADAPGLSSLNLRMDGPRVAVDGRLRTSVKGVVAIGDLSARFPYAHTAFEHARLVALDAAGKPEEMDETKVPHVVFTSPEVASVGMGEAEAKAAGFEVRVVKNNWAANSKARILGEIQGWAKLVCDAKQGRILGVHLVGPEATDLIGEACVLVGKGMTLDELGKVLHPHPTLSEIFAGH
jgi:dihydrolipoamide dehydrogenase